MNEKDVLFFIVDEFGRSGRVVNKTVQFLGQPKALPNAPIGSQEISIGWERDLNDYANVRSFSLELGFVLDGRSIIADGIYRSNVDRKLYLVIKRRVTEITGTTYAAYYKHLYKGEFDLSTSKDEQGDGVWRVSIMEGGIQKLIKANRGTQYTIPFDSDAVDVLMDGIELTEKHNYLFQPGITGTLIGVNYREGVLFINKEGAAYGFASFTSYKGLLGTPDAEDNNYFATSVQIINGVRIFTPQPFNITPGLDDDYNLYVRIYNSDTDTFRDITLVELTGVTPDTDISFDETFDLVANDRLYLFTTSYLSHDESSAFSIEFKSKFRTTTIKAFPPLTLFKKLVERITGSADNAASTLLAASTYYFTSGDGLRGLIGSNVGVKISLNDFFKAVNVYHMAGMGYQDKKWIIEDRARFFVTGGGVQLGNAKDMVISPASNLLYSSIKVGHREQNVDDINGRYDFNGYQIYTTPQKTVSREMDLQSPVKAGPYEIETTRINFDGRTTTDSSSDNDVFVLDVEDAAIDNVYHLRRDIVVTAGVPSPETIFNVRLSPHRLLLVHGAWIRGTLKGFEGQNIVLASANSNTSLVAGGITESASVMVAALPAPLFSPYYIDFDTLATADIADTLEADINRSFVPNWNDNDVEGFLINVGIAPVTEEEQTFKLLLSPETDLTKFINLPANG